MPLFIVFEGGDGAGKTTQAKALYKRLLKEQHPVVYTQEPGGTFLGNIIQKWLTLPEGIIRTLLPEDSQLFLIEQPIADPSLPDIILRSTAPRAEFLLFLLARAQLVDEVILPSLSQGRIVICDRHAPSSVAYQGYGRGLDIRLIETANDIATRGLKPDLIVLLDLVPEEGLARKRETPSDRLEERELAFHQRVREGYLTMAAADAEHWLVVDATLPRKEVERVIWEKVKSLLQREGAEGV